jgi:hypothetical protein
MSHHRREKVFPYPVGTPSELASTPLSCSMMIDLEWPLLNRVSWGMNLFLWTSPNQCICRDERVELQSSPIRRWPEVTWDSYELLLSFLDVELISDMIACGCLPYVPTRRWFTVWPLASVSDFSRSCRALSVWPKPALSGGQRLND